MAGLSTDIIGQLREVLLRCGPFDSNRSLRAVFTDGRIYAWRDRVPEAGSRAGRVDALIDELLDRTNPQGVPALALFAEVLADRVSPGDACRHSLAQVAVDLRAATRSRSPTVLEPAPRPNEPRIDTGGGAYVGGNVEVGERGSFVGRDVHGDVVMGEKTTTFDQRGQQVQQQTNVAGDYYDRHGAPTYVTYIENARGVAIGDSAKAAAHDADVTDHQKLLQRLCVDVAVPSKVVVGRAFVLAVALREPMQPVLSLERLDKTVSEDLTVLWPDGLPFLPLRLVVNAPDCLIVGTAERVIRYHPEHSLSVHRFQLVPQALGVLNILISVFQEEFSLGDKDVETIVIDEHLAGAVTIAVETSVLKRVSKSSSDAGRITPHRSQESRVALAVSEERTRSALQPGILSAMRVRLSYLDDIQLDALCIDYFPDVYDRFSRGMRRDEKVNLLLDHCRRNAPAMAKLTRLLDA